LLRQLLPVFSMDDDFTFDVINPKETLPDGRMLTGPGRAKEHKSLFHPL